jgi:ADP-ribose pyrophosphatase YjhB (NUDIX family)
VVVQPVGGLKPPDIKLVFQREPYGGKTWFPADSILPNEAHVDATVRELFEEFGLTLAVDDLTLLSGNHARVPLPAAQHQLVHVVLVASILVMYVITKLRTPTKVVQYISAHSTNHSYGTYTVPSTIDIDGLSLKPSKISLVRETQFREI